MAVNSTPNISFGSDPSVFSQEPDTSDGCFLKQLTDNMFKPIIYFLSDQERSRFKQTAHWVLDIIQATPLNFYTKMTFADWDQFNRLQHIEARLSYFMGKMNQSLNHIALLQEYGELQDPVITELVTTQKKQAETIKKQQSSINLLSAITWQLSILFFMCLVYHIHKMRHHLLMQFKS